MYPSKFSWVYHSNKEKHVIDIFKLFYLRTSSHKSSKRSSRSSSSDSSSSSRSSSTSSSTSSSSSSRSSVSSKEDAETNKEEVKKTEKADDSKQRSDSESKTAVKEMNHASIQPSNPDNSSISNSFTHNQQFQINRFIFQIDFLLLPLRYYYCFHFILGFNSLLLLLLFDYSSCLFHRFYFIANKLTFFLAFNIRYF